MANKIKVKRGKEVNLPILDVGEPAFTTDTKKPFIGSDTGNIELATKEQINHLDAELDAIVANVTVDSEVILARGTETTLGNRLDKQSSELDAIATKITFGKNLLDKANVTVGKYVNHTNGNLSNNASYDASDYISVKPNTQYTRNQALYMAFYDIDKIYISGLDTGSSKTFTTPINCYYIRCTTSDSNTFQVEEGVIETSYEPFGYKISREIPWSYQGIIPWLSIPDTIYGVVGCELNVYIENILSDKVENYQVTLSSTVGITQNERWTFTPATAGTYTLAISVYKDYATRIIYKSVKVIIKEANVGTGITKKALFIGDSTTANGAVTGELLTMFGADVMDLTLIGSQGTVPNIHEGYSGKATPWFTTNVSSPFVFSGVFNFSQYMSSKGYSGLNYVILHLGINDVFAASSDSAAQTAINAMLDAYENMITSINTYDATIKIGICVTIPPALTQDAFGKDYGASRQRWRYKRNNALLAKSIISKFAGRTTSGIYLIPLNTNIDTVYNFASETIAVNSRNTTLITRQSSGVHPSNDGYEQMADTLYYWLKSFEV